jgi:hypothetical protein
LWVHQMKVYNTSWNLKGNPQKQKFKNFKLSKTLSVQPWTYLFYLIPSHLDVKYSQKFPSVFGRHIILMNSHQTKKRKNSCRPKILLTLKRRCKSTTPAGLRMFRFMIMFAWIYIH